MCFVLGFFFVWLVWFVMVVLVCVFVCWLVSFGLVCFFPELYWVLPKPAGKIKCFQQEALNHFLLCSENCSLHTSLRAKSSAPFLEWSWQQEGIFHSCVRIFLSLLWDSEQNQCILLIQNVLSEQHCFKRTLPNFRYQWKLILMHQYPISSETISI